MQESTLGRALGWFSIGLGLVEVIASKKVGHCLGMSNQTDLLRLYGVREICTGVGILAQPTNSRMAPWLWKRVGGDLLDLGTLSAALAAGTPKQGNARFATAAVAGITFVDLLCAIQLSHDEEETIDTELE